LKIRWSAAAPQSVRALPRLRCARSCKVGREPRPSVAPVTGHFSRLFLASDFELQTAAVPPRRTTREIYSVFGPRGPRASKRIDRREETDEPASPRARERRGQWKGITRSSEPRRRPPTRPSEAISAGDSVSRHLTASGAPAAPHASRRRWRGCPTLGGEPV